jgi:hypothetical protein
MATKTAAKKSNGAGAKTSNGDERKPTMPKSDVPKASENKAAERQTRLQSAAVEQLERQGEENERYKLKLNINTKAATKDFVGRVDAEPIKEQEVEDRKNGTFGFGPGVTTDVVDDLELIDQEEGGEVVDHIIAGPLQGTVVGASPLNEPQKVQRILDEKSSAGKEREQTAAASKEDKKTAQKREAGRRP